MGFENTLHIHGCEAMIDLGAYTLGDRGLVASSKDAITGNYSFLMLGFEQVCRQDGHHVGFMRDLTALWEDSPPVFYQEDRAEWTKSVRANALRVLGAFRNATKRPTLPRLTRASVDDDPAFDDHPP